MRELGTILVVDDNRDWCRKIKAILEEDGFSVKTAKSLKKALRILMEQPIHAMVIDLKLDAVDLGKDEGFALLEKVQRLGLSEATHSIMLTGHATPAHTRDAFIKHNVIDFFEKNKLDFQRDEFRQAIKKAVMAEIRQLVSKDRLEQALEGLSSRYPDDSTQLSRRLTHIRAQLRKGTITQEKADSERARVAEAILDLISS
jgi:DNA-binding NtrC family response regulator